MDLFEVKNDQVTFSPVALALKPFKALWDRDKTKGKTVAIAELAALYYFADYKSDFSEILDPTEKMEVIKSVIVGMSVKWVPDAKFEEAVAFYKERQQTITTVLLEDAKMAVSKISSFLKDVDLDVTDVKKVSDVLGNLPKTVETLNSLENSVKKELQQKDSLRGGHAKATFEDGIN